ncbi:hypothetical protein LINGRAHAP2_LOCUS9197 [Linum grandiflorum]
MYARLHHTRPLLLPQPDKQPSIVTTAQMMMEKSRSFSGYSEMRRMGFEHKSNSYSFNGGASDADASSSSSENPEVKRRKRVAQYNVYSKEGKLKTSLRNSFKWIKSKFIEDYFHDRKFDGI